MNSPQIVERDERTIAVENASYRWAYMILTYAILVDVVIRGIFRNEAAWDLMAFVIVSGIFCTIYQSRLQTLVHGWSRKVMLVSLAAAVVAAVVATIVVSVRG